MRVKIAAGLAVLAGSWIALYVLARFMEVCCTLPFGRTRADLLLLNIAHDSNHNAISSGHW